MVFLIQAGVDDKNMSYMTEDWIIMYVERLLKVSTVNGEGIVTGRTKGTPQGGVISPILANIFLHVVFDAWMEEH